MKATWLPKASPFSSNARARRSASPSVRKSTGFLYPPTGALQNNDCPRSPFNVPAEPRYLAATLSRPEGQVSVSLYVAVDRGDAFPETKDRVAVLLDVIEAKPMEAKMVTVDAATMAKDIAATGRVAL